MEQKDQHIKPVLTKKEKRRRHGRRFLRVFVVISVLIILIHIFAPMIALHFINKKMANMPEYTGHIDALQINLFTLQATVNGFTLKKKSGEIPVPFVDMSRCWVGLDWKALLHKRIVGKVEVDNFALNFVKGPTKATTQTKIDKSWIDYFDKMMPIDINRMQVNNGEVHYRDFHSYPKIDVFMDNIYVTAENLSTVKDTTKILPASAKVTANLYGGSLEVNAKANVFKKGIPDFDVNAEIKNLPLTYLNNFLKAYAKMDVQKGTFSVYAEAAAKDGKIKGYAKPLIKDLQMINSQERKGMPVKDQIIESLVDVVAWIFKNKKTERLGTKVDLEGSIVHPQISVWGMIGEVLVNAFIEALMPSLENTININSVGTEDDKNFLQKIFEPDKKKNKHKKDKEKQKPIKKNKKHSNKSTSGM
jgi:hypothetical protein